MCFRVLTGGFIKIKKHSAMFSQAEPRAKIKISFNSHIKVQEHNQVPALTMFDIVQCGYVFYDEDKINHNAFHFSYIFSFTKSYNNNVSIDVNLQH